MIFSQFLQKSEQFSLPWSSPFFFQTWYFKNTCDTRAHNIQGRYAQKEWSSVHALMGSASAQRHMIYYHNKSNRNIIRFLSLLSIVPFVTFTGLGLFHLGFPNLAECVEVGLLQLITMLIFSIDLLCSSLRP